MSVVNPNISHRRRRENLTLILHVRIRLDDRDRIVSLGVRLQIRVPQQPIATPAAASGEASLQRPAARAQHHRISLCDHHCFSPAPFRRSLIGLFFLFTATLFRPSPVSSALFLFARSSGAAVANGNYNFFFYFL
ncbi:unnamed protein product [Linum trigynum]|uniref:Uncharacterized protein n=1 Tax=Linum trigynum TaxID=586398 RepID=A0AAV2CL46_9ROSI